MRGKSSRLILSVKGSLQECNEPFDVVKKYANRQTKEHPLHQQGVLLFYRKLFNRVMVLPPDYYVLICNHLERVVVFHFKDHIRCKQERFRLTGS